MGIPTVSVTRGGFERVVDLAFAGLGFPPEAPWAILPDGVFLPGGDVTPLEKKIDEIVGGLTKWGPKTKEKGVFATPKVTADGKDYQEAVDNMNLLFMRNGWSDTLPVLPPTEERVGWLLAGTDLPRDTVLGKILPRGGIATVEVIGAIAAMAGCRPEYMPVLIAATKAIIDPKFMHWAMNSTTVSCYPVVIVNGPMAKQIRLNSGYGCLGPDPGHPAGGVIGRAIRLLMLTLGGAIPGSGSMSIYGGPARYIGLVFAEDDDSLPPDWEALNVERGFPRASNVVTCDAVSSTVNLSGGGIAGTEEEAVKILHRTAFNMRLPNSNYWRERWLEGSPGYILLPHKGAKSLSALGWSKGKVKTFLWENSKVPWSDITRVRSPREIVAHMDAANTRGGVKENEPWPITRRPENIKIVVAGGAQADHWFWAQSFFYPLQSVSVEIGVPANWERLLKKAAEELGPAV